MSTRRYPKGLAWRRRAACLNHPVPWIWFSRNPVLVAEARAICFACPVRSVCLESQLDYERQIGHSDEVICGGRTASDRRVILERRTYVELERLAVNSPRVHEKVGP